jgi:hypothetical protein
MALLFPFSFDEITTSCFISKVLKPTAEGAEIRRDIARFRFFSSVILGALCGLNIFGCGQKPR